MGWLKIFTLIICVIGVAEASPKIDSRPAGPISHHQLLVSIDPEVTTARFRDKLTVHPAGAKGSVLHFHLHKNYPLEKAEVLGQKGWSIRSTESPDKNTGLTLIHVQKPGGLAWPDPLELEFRYSGPIAEASAEENATRVLAQRDYFYPQRVIHRGDPELLTFEVSVTTPQPWKVVSQGQKISERMIDGQNKVVWKNEVPLEEIFIIADCYEETQESFGAIQLHTYLKEKDAELAGRYIQAARKYIDFYQKLIGPYPFPKFALVENSMQTGYGMPSFTLLGSRIIRFPFILHTSYPHEILHNWWGNGVYIKPKGGNWAEGLTTYLADHLLLELQGKGPAYRFQELKKYVSYVNPSNDFPLAQFRGREDMASQAVGYGKTLMVLHMLRTEVGDAKFLETLRVFFKNNLYRFTGFEGLKESFEAVNSRDLTKFFAQWVGRTGAPELELVDATVVISKNRRELQLKVRQNQPGPAYFLTLPVATWFVGVPQPAIERVRLDKKEQTLHLQIPEGKEPAAVMLDPYTELFRRLGAKEIPPSIGATYGESRLSRILPEKEEYPDVLLGYHQFAQALAEDHPGPLLDDNLLSPVPNGGLWVFGRNNQYGLRHLQAQLEAEGVELNDDGVLMDGERFPWKDHSFVFSLRRPGNRKGSVTWLIAGKGESIPGLLRKLPHYGKYGFLVFEGDAPQNVFKKVWESSHAGLIKIFQPGERPLPSQPPLVPFKPEN